MPKSNRVFTPKQPKKKEGDPKPVIGFRCPVDVLEWLRKLKQEGHDQSQTIVTALRVGRDVATRIGDKWFEVEYRALRRDIPPGVMLAELALAAITAERNGGAPPPTEPTPAANNKK